MAVFTLDNDRTRTVHFGSAGASDYTQHRDLVRKRQYLARHAPREHWENPMTAGEKRVTALLTSLWSVGGRRGYVAPKRSIGYIVAGVPILGRSGSIAVSGRLSAV